MDSMTPPTLPRPHVLRLPDTATVDDVADASRDAWRVFMEQSQDWGVAELVLWSNGFYGPAARYASSPHGADESRDDDEFSGIDPRFVDRMILTARAKLVETLWSFSLPRARLEFACAMRERGAVTPCQDSRGVRAFLPTPPTDALVDRVLALVAADLLTRPNDFEAETMCSHCGSIALGRAPCCAHAATAHDSGIVGPARETVMPATSRTA